MLLLSMDEQEPSSPVHSDGDRSVDSRFLFEEAYANWAASSGSVLPVTMHSEILFTSSPSPTSSRGSSSTRTIPTSISTRVDKASAAGAPKSIHERLYGLSEVYAKKREAQSRIQMHEQEEKLRKSSFLTQSKRRSSSTGRMSLNRSTTTPVHDRLLDWQIRRDARVEDMRVQRARAKDDLELASLTFRPCLASSFNEAHQGATRKRDVFDSLYEFKSKFDMRRNERL